METYLFCRVNKFSIQWRESTVHVLKWFRLIMKYTYNFQYYYSLCHIYGWKIINTYREITPAVRYHFAYDYQAVNDRYISIQKIYEWLYFYFLCFIYGSSPMVISLAWSNFSKTIAILLKRWIPEQCTVFLSNMNNLIILYWQNVFHDSRYFYELIWWQLI